MFIARCLQIMHLISAAPPVRFMEKARKHYFRQRSRSGVRELPTGV
jgi:hypothetical protein